MDPGNYRLRPQAPVPSRAQLIERVVDYQEKLAAGDSRGADRALERVCDGVARLVSQHVARLMANDPGGVYDEDDLYQVGMAGVVKAAKGFDASSGWAFTTLASMSVDREIRRFRAAARRGFRLSGQVDAEDRAAEAARRVLADLGSQHPTAEDVAARLRESAENRVRAGKTVVTSLTTITPEKVASLPSFAGQVTSLDRRLAPDGDNPATLGDMLSDMSETDGEAVGRVVSEAVRDAIAGLPPDERQAVELRVGFDGTPRSFRQVGEEMGVTGRVVERSWERSARRLRAELAAFADA